MFSRAHALLALAAITLWILIAFAVTARSQTLNLTTPRAAFVSTAPPRFTNGNFSASWIMPTNFPDLRGFRLAWGTNAAALNTATEVGKGITNLTVRGLAELAVYFARLTSVSTNGVESEPATSSVTIQPGWRVYSYSTAFSTVLQAGRTNIVQSSTNSGATWRDLTTNVTGGTVAIVRTNSIGANELFRIKP